MTNCSVCYGPCDPPTHAASLRIRRYLRERVRLSLLEPAIISRPVKPVAPAPKAVLPPAPAPPAIPEPPSAPFGGQFGRTGRPQKVDRTVVAAMKARGVPVAKIARELGVSRNALYLKKRQPLQQAALSRQQRALLKEMRGGLTIYDQREGPFGEPEHRGVDPRVIRGLLGKGLIYKSGEHIYAIRGTNDATATPGC